MANGRLQRSLEKYLVNPGTRLLLRLGVAPKAFALVETTGCRSGKRRRTPVGNGLEGSTFWLVTEHGLGCDYVKNIVANPSVRVRVGRRWHHGTAELLPEDDALNRRRQIDERNGRIGKFDGVIFRLAAGTPLTVRVMLDD
jgi:deazaflavin-dependent oxidoreductase (nitroreductase family)